MVMILVYNSSFTECIPDATDLDSDPDMGKLVVKLRKILQEASQPAPKLPPPNYDLVQSKVTLQAVGLELGDKCVVGGLKVCIVTYTVRNVTLIGRQ